VISHLTVNALFLEQPLTQKKPVASIEPITIGMMAVCYVGLAVSTALLPQISLILAFLATTVFIALHSSLQHEALHGHPTRFGWMNELLVFPAVGLLIPYRRFKALHLAHHHDEILTDPYDDPESNFLEPAIWQGLPAWQKILRQFNNTLFGRILVGPMLSMIALIRDDSRAIGKKEAGVLLGWVLHALGILPVSWWLIAYGTMPLWLYIVAAYFGFGLLKIRTYLEHRAHDTPRGRTVLVADRGPLALLFLNNNFHVVHHSHPSAPWYQMRALYDADPEKYLSRNDGYFYDNYWTIFKAHFFRAKDPVSHPLWDSLKRR
jgi:fatty acid desaturase